MVSPDESLSLSFAASRTERSICPIMSASNCCAASLTLDGFGWAMGAIEATDVGGAIGFVIYS
jgi:hypothetical protein